MQLQLELRNVQALSSQADSAENTRLQEELEEARRQLAEAQKQLASPMRNDRLDSSRPYTPEPPRFVFNELLRRVIDMY